MQMYDLLQDHMTQPKFLKQLEEAKEDTELSSKACIQGDEVLREDWWEAPKGATRPETESDEGYLEVQLLHLAVSSQVQCSDSSC